MDPRARQRQEVVPVRTTVQKDVSNAELLESFQRATAGKMSAKTLESYCGSLRDALRYFTTEGREVPLRSWTKENVWAYVHFVEANYCASFAPAPFRPEKAVCRQRVWIGTKPAEAAARENCASCPLFKRPTVVHR